MNITPPTEDWAYAEARDHLRVLDLDEGLVHYLALALRVAHGNGVSMGLQIAHALCGEKDEKPVVDLRFVGIGSETLQ